MDKLKEAKLNMYHSVEDLCDTNLVTVALVPAFEDRFNVFKTTIAAIVTNRATLAALTGGLRTTKQEAKENLAQLGSKIAERVRAYASVINDSTLKAAMKIPASRIRRALDDDVVDICSNIYSTANSLVASLADYGVTPAVLTTFATAIADYNTKAPKPKQSQNEKKSVREQTDILYADADRILVEQMDTLVNNFLDNGNAVFEGQYRAARVLVDPGSFTTVLKLKVINGATGDPLVGAKVYRDAGDTFKRSSKLGYVTYKDIEQGNHTFVLKHKLFNDLLVPPIPIGYGNKKTITVVMIPIGTVSNGNNVVAEGSIPESGIFNLDTSQIGATVNSSVLVEISGGELNIYAAELLDQPPGATFWHLTDGTTVVKSLPEFAVLIGSSDTKKKVTLQNPGTTTTHYKITFMNLEGE